MYFEPDTPIGKFEAGITKFIVTTNPLHRDKVFAALSVKN
jgi:hypothetical protein